ncbi:MAG: hypothetical protein CME06_06580 [Gemmatimonadetes bacterium]|nr:hypothetical protein [Gemmatimonadota bacterium]
MKQVSIFVLILLGAVLLAAGNGLPLFGDPHAPAAKHVSDHYIEHAYHDAHTPNFVTVMIADYRSFDTLGETMVVFAAGMACLLLLRGHVRRRGGVVLPPIVHRDDSIITDLVTRAMVPVIQIFALYVVFHGHYSPGGGFQGGALLAGSVLLVRVVLGQDRSNPIFPVSWGTPFGVAGLAIFLGVGLVALAFGGSGLQYDHLPLGLEPDMLRNWGILIAEIGVAFAVMGTLVSIFDDLSGESGEVA